MTFNRRSLFKAAAALPLAAGATSLLASSVAASTAKIGQQVAGIYRFTVGQAEVTALLDGFIDVAPQLITGYDDETATRLLRDNMQAPTETGLRIPVNGYLINAGGGLTLVDTGTAQLMGPTLGGLVSTLKTVGVAPEDIDMVLLTHMHPDHSGGLVDATGAAVFPNAELVVSQTEWGFWTDDAILAGVPEENRGFFQMARMTTAPYADRLRLFQGEIDLGNGLSSLPLPGHTPGHSGFLLNDGDDSLLFWGDLIHLTALQFERPDWTVVFDADPAQTVDTRRRMLDRAAADGLRVTGAHLDFPGLGRVLRGKDGYRYQAAPWQYAL